MPAFSDRLTPEDLDSVLAYVRLTFLPQETAVEAAPVEEGAAENAAAADPALVALGAETYAQACARCHGGVGEGTQRGRALTGIALEQPNASIHIASVSDGKGNMPAFAEQLTGDQIIAVVGWVRSEF